MSTSYSITAVTPTDVRQGDGSYTPAYVVHYEAATTPPVTGAVTVTKAKMGDPGAWAAEVHDAIAGEVAAHTAMLAGPSS